jgi:hypothetical protein
MSHSRGPWHVGKSRTNQGQIPVVTGVDRVALIDDNSDEAMANAHLVAAAPDLYEALKETLEAAKVAARFIAERGLTSAFLNQTTHIRNGFGVRAQQAIAKVEGK